MELFIPNICAVQSMPPVCDKIEKNAEFKNINATQSSEFQKVYFEELAKKCYEDNGNFESISGMARIHYEESYGGGNIPLKRWKIFFSKYNILINIEDNNGNVHINAA